MVKGERIIKKGETPDKDVIEVVLQRPDGGHFSFRGFRPKVEANVKQYFAAPPKSPQVAPPLPAIQKARKPIQRATVDVGLSEPVSFVGGGAVQRAEAFRSGILAQAGRQERAGGQDIGFHGQRLEQELLRGSLSEERVRLQVQPLSPEGEPLTTEPVSFIGIGKETFPRAKAFAEAGIKTPFPDQPILLGRAKEREEKIKEFESRIFPKETKIDIPTPTVDTSRAGLNRMGDIQRTVEGFSFGDLIGDFLKPSKTKIKDMPPGVGLRALEKVKPFILGELETQKERRGRAKDTLSIISDKIGGKLGFLPEPPKELARFTEEEATKAKTRKKVIKERLIGSFASTASLFGLIPTKKDIEITKESLIGFGAKREQAILKTLGGVKTKTKEKITGIKLDEPIFDVRRKTVIESLKKGLEYEPTDPLSRLGRATGKEIDKIIGAATPVVKEKTIKALKKIPTTPSEVRGIYRRRTQPMSIEPTVEAQRPAAITSLITELVVSGVGSKYITTKLAKRKFGKAVSVLGTPYDDLITAKIVSKDSLDDVLWASWKYSDDEIDDIFKKKRERYMVKLISYDDLITAKIVSKDSLDDFLRASRKYSDDEIDDIFKKISKDFTDDPFLLTSKTGQKYLITPKVGKELADFTRTQALLQGRTSGVFIKPGSLKVTDDAITLKKKGKILGEIDFDFSGEAVVMSKRFEPGKLIVPTQKTSIATADILGDVTIKLPGKKKVVTAVESTGDVFTTPKGIFLDTANVDNIFLGLADTTKAQNTFSITRTLTGKKKIDVVGEGDIRRIFNYDVPKGKVYWDAIRTITRDTKKPKRIKGLFVGDVLTTEFPEDFITNKIELGLMRPGRKKPKGDLIPFLIQVQEEKVIAKAAEDAISRAVSTGKTTLISAQTKTIPIAPLTLGAMLKPKRARQAPIMDLGVGYDTAPPIGIVNGVDVGGAMAVEPIFKTDFRQVSGTLGGIRLGEKVGQKRGQAFKIKTIQIQRHTLAQMKGEAQSPIQRALSGQLQTPTQTQKRAQATVQRAQATVQRALQGQTEITAQKITTKAIPDITIVPGISGITVGVGGLGVPIPLFIPSKIHKGRRISRKSQKPRKRITQYAPSLAAIGLGITRRGKPPKFVGPIEIRPIFIGEPKKKRKKKGKKRGR